MQRQHDPDVWQGSADLEQHLDAEVGIVMQMHDIRLDILQHQHEFSRELRVGIAVGEVVVVTAKIDILVRPEGLYQADAEALGEAILGSHVDATGGDRGDEALAALGQSGDGSVSQELLPLLKDRDREIKTSALFEPTYWQGFRMYMGIGEGPRGAIIAAAVEARADIISPYKLYANPDFIHAAHTQNLAVIPWTVNDKDEMVKLLRDGVDGIISDYPDRLMAAYKIARRN